MRAAAAGVSPGRSSQSWRIEQPLWRDRLPGCLDAQAFADGLGGRRAIERVEVQAWHLRIDEPLTQIRHDIEAECTDRFAVVAEAFQTACDPARYFGAAHLGETHQLREVRDRHDARHD